MESKEDGSLRPLRRISLPENREHGDRARPMSAVAIPVVAKTVHSAASGSDLSIWTRFVLPQRALQGLLVKAMSVS
jgi:hypothetical protein